MKQLVMDAIYNKKTARVPWVPFVGCHAASLIGVTAEEFFKNEQHIVDGVTKAYEMYRPDGLPVLFDLQLEAEALGCDLQFAADNPPAVASHPLEQGKKLSDLKVPTINDGRFPIVMNATKRICEALGDKIALYGLITGPFTLALHLMGTDIFYNMADDEDVVHELMQFCEKVCIATTQMYLDAGCDIIAVVDPMTSQISPNDFATFVTPYATNIFTYIKEKGAASSFFVCGNAKRNIEEMCKCKPDNVSIDENIPLDYVRDICKQHGISFGGNIKLTLSMLFGAPVDNINDAQNCMAIGGDTGFILAPGCDMPFATPAENVLAVSSLVHGEVTQFIASTNVLEGVTHNLPDYSKETQVVIDVVTLDSESCAPCQYMMEAVADACRDFGDKVRYVEHKVKQKEGVCAMLALGASNIPTICIDGVVKHVSIIPKKDILQADIKEAISKK